MTSVFNFSGASILLDIVFLAFAVLLLWGIRIRHFNEASFDYLSREQSTPIRGCAALAVVLHHFSQNVPYGALFCMFTRAGVLAVGLFFFYSGYGLMHQYKTKDNYAASFFRHRLPSVLIPYLIVVGMWCAAYLVHDRSIASVVNRILEIKDGTTIIPYSWYVFVILALYIVFGITIKYAARKREKKPLLTIIVATAFCCIWIVVSTLIGFGGWWNNSCLCFVLGMIWNHYQEKINHFLSTKSHALSVATASFIIFLIAFLRYNIFSTDLMPFLPEIFLKLLRYGFSIVEPLIFCIVAVMILMHLRIGNRVSTWLGGISYEIYLVQGIAISAMNKLMITHRFAAVIIVILSTVIMAVVLNQVDRWTIKRIQNDKK